MSKSLPCIWLLGRKRRAPDEIVLHLQGYRLSISGEKHKMARNGISKACPGGSEEYLPLEPDEVNPKP